MINSAQNLNLWSLFLYQMLLVGMKTSTITLKAQHGVSVTACSARAIKGKFIAQENYGWHLFRNLDTKMF